MVQSTALVVIGAIYFFNTDLAMMLFFTGIGGWQLLSAGIHFSQQWNQRYLGRRIYHYLLLLIVVTFLISLVSATILIWVLYALLFITPVMAFYYLVVCYLEYFSKK